LQLQAIYASAPVGLSFVDAGLRYVSINKRMAELNGLEPEKHLGRSIREVLRRELADSMEPYYRHVLETGRPEENIELQGLADGEKRFWLCSYYPVREQSGAITGVNAMVQEISARKKMEEEIRHLANHDALTGLPNRRLFIELIALEKAQSRRHGTRMAVFFLDLDRFKIINDTLGHEAGDELLKKVAAGLRSTVRSSDTVARIGGDEFNIIVPDISRAEDAGDVARKIMDYFVRSFLVAGQEFHISASLGISIFPDDTEEIDTLLRYADIAMYHAKEKGRNRFEFYNPDINTRSLELMRLEAWLGQSVKRGELVMHYQPLVDIASRRIVCAEALVRWRHPERGMLDPAQFIPLAEETGFISTIDEWVLGSVCRQVKAWIDAGIPALCVTVNLSARLFENPGVVATITRILKETGLPADHLDLEITESMAMSNVELTADRLKELTGMGIHISIDDFGTGYSSLSYLKRLPINRLKIDRSFVQDIATDADDRTIISAVTAMAHNMKMKVIAEGVETDEQLAFLEQTGCDEMQGYLFSRPLPAEEFETLMAAGR
jgi:diguanylate cyclase (GGDEF)-like protein/PAS domain S-box-containing protein